VVSLATWGAWGTRMIFVRSAAVTVTSTTAEMSVRAPMFQKASL
jgi:hypothetical protein